MQSASSSAIAPKTLLTARILSGVAIMFLIFDTALKVFNLPPAVEGTTQLGYPATVVVKIGIVELLCLVLYVVPRTAVFGAILLTGYLGGAIATHVRIGSPLFTHTLFPMYVALLVWGGLFLRDERLRAMIPLRRAAGTSETFLP